MNYYVKNVLTYKGATISVKDYLASVESMCANAKFPRAKARGSLGGASNGGFISIVNGIVTRVR